MQAFEVRHLRLITGFGERFETGLDECGDATTENGLLAEQIGFSLFGEGGLDDAGAGSADGIGVGQCEFAGVTSCVLLDGDEARNATALGVGAADEMAWALGRMLKPWAKNNASPSTRFGAISASYTDFCSVSGRRIMIASAHLVASAIDITVRPSASALACDEEPSRRPTTTLTPDSLRLSAWAWPCEP
jgi:hypothetical protein